jgi:hypothetical protein
LTFPFLTSAKRFSASFAHSLSILPSQGFKLLIRILTSSSRLSAGSEMSSSIIVFLIFSSCLHCSPASIVFRFNIYFNHFKKVNGFCIQGSSRCGFEAWFPSPSPLEHIDRAAVRKAVVRACDAVVVGDEVLIARFTTGADDNEITTSCVYTQNRPPLSSGEIRRGGVLLEKFRYTH